MSTWLSHPWAARVAWPDLVSMQRGCLGAVWASLLPSCVLLRPVPGALPVVGHVGPLGATDIVDEDGIAVTRMRIYTHGHEPALVLVPNGAVLAYVDARCADAAFLAGSLPAGLEGELAPYHVLLPWLKPLAYAALVPEPEREVKPFVPAAEQKQLGLF